MNANVKMSGFPTWVLQLAVLQNDCGKEQMMIYYSVLFFFFPLAPCILFQKVPMMSLSAMKT